LAGPIRFSDEDLRWLEQAERPGADLPDAIAQKLVDGGLAGRTADGLKLTPLGATILGNARKSGLLA